MTNAHLNFFLDFRRGQLQPILPVITRNLIVEDAKTHAIKRLQRLRELEAKMRSATAQVRTMHG
jgi:putative sterol carrier protein